MRPVKLADRKRLLELALHSSPAAVRVVPYVRNDGRELASFVLEHDLEGLVAKRADSPYVAGASSAWTKVKRPHEEEFLVTRCRRDRDGRTDAISLTSNRAGRLTSQGVAELGVWRVSSPRVPSTP